jgi:hypothetical protein
VDDQEPDTGLPSPLPTPLDPRSGQGLTMMHMQLEFGGKHGTSLDKELWTVRLRHTETI